MYFRRRCQTDGGYLLLNLKDLVDIGNDLLAVNSQRDTASNMLKQGKSHLCFQLLDLRRYGGLRIAELLGGFCKAS